MEAYRETHSNHANCDNLCPLECDSISFDVSKITRNLEQDYDYYSERYLNNSKDYKKENILIGKIQYTSMKYNDMSQTAKITFTDLVSNIGGVVGVFLEMSFFSIYRTLEKLSLLHFN